MATINIIIVALDGGCGELLLRLLLLRLLYNRGFSVLVVKREDRSNVRDILYRKSESSSKFTIKNCLHKISDSNFCVAHFGWVHLISV